MTGAESSPPYQSNPCPGSVRDGFALPPPKGAAVRQANDTGYGVPCQAELRPDATSRPGKEGWAQEADGSDGPRKGPGYFEGPYAPRQRPGRHARAPPQLKEETTPRRKDDDPAGHVRQLQQPGATLPERGQHCGSGPRLPQFLDERIQQGGRGMAPVHLRSPVLVGLTQGVQAPGPRVEETGVVAVEQAVL